MMYKNKFASAVKINGKILREEDGEVKIPFKSEYSIFLKNLNSRKAVVSVSIDGDDVLDGKKIIVEPNCISELEGFLKENIVTNKFKFVKRIKDIEEFRGIHVDDGIIRIEVQYEKEIPYVYPTYTITTTPAPYRYEKYTWYDYKTSGDTKSCSWNVETDGFPVAMACGATFSSSDVRSLDAGITVHGNESNQKFNYGHVGKLENESTVIVLQLVGYDGETLITTRDKIHCSVCGKSNKSNNKFCYNCGNCLD
jgi:hypothetical protein